MASMDLLGNVWHVVRGEQGIQRIKSLLAWQKRTGLNPRILLLQDRPEKLDYRIGPYFLCPLELEVDAASTLRVPMTVVEGDFTEDSPHQRYQAFQHFGRVFWATLANALKLGDRDVLQLHSLSLGFLMAENPRILGKGPGIVFSPRYANPQRGNEFISHILEKEPLSSPSAVIYRSFLEATDGRGTIKYPLNKGYVFQGLPTTIEDIDALTAVYLQAVYGVGYQFSLNLTTRALESGQPVVDALFIMTPEKEGEIPQVKEALITGSIVGDPVLGVLYDPGGITVIGISDTPSTTGNPNIIPWKTVGGNLQAYLYMLRRALEDPAVDQKCTVIMTEAGSSTRLPNAEDSKGSTQIGETTLRNAGLASLLHVIRQSPNQGEGMIFLAGVDNINAGSGPLFSGRNRLLSHAPYGMMLGMLPHSVDPSDLAALEKFRLRGTAIVDRRIMEILLMLEKEGPEVLSEALKGYGVSILEENTMWQMLTVDFARDILELLDHPSYADPSKTLLEHYRILDLSTDMVSTQTLKTTRQREKYIEGLEKRCRKAGIAFDERDAEMILDGAKALNEVSSGLGAIELGFFSDAGDWKAYADFHGLLLDPDPKTRDLRNFLRFACGLSETQNIHLPPEQINMVSGTETTDPNKVNITGDPETIYVGEGVRIAPGTEIHSHTMIVRASNLAAPMTLPPHLLVSGARILAPTNFSSAADPNHLDPWRIFYNVTLGPAAAGLPVPNDCAVVGFRLPPLYSTKKGKWVEREQVGRIPVSVALKRDRPVIDPSTGKVALDPVLGFYPLIENIPHEVELPGVGHTWDQFLEHVTGVRPTTKA